MSQHPDRKLHGESEQERVGVDSHARQTAIFGRAVAWSVSLLIVVYSITLVLGLLSLASPDEAIGNPYFTLLEVLIMLIAPLMVLSMVLVYRYAAPERKVYALGGLAFMVIVAGITCSLHFAILTLSRHPVFAELVHAPLIFSFEWPSLVYALDILAWDFFFALAMLVTAPVFKKTGMERIIRYLMILSGVLCFAGLLGIPLGNMQVRNIGIIGYTIVAIPIFLLLGVAFVRKSNS